MKKTAALALFLVFICTTACAKDKPEDVFCAIMRTDNKVHRCLVDSEARTIDVTIAINPMRIPSFCRDIFKARSIPGSVVSEIKGYSVRLFTPFVRHDPVVSCKLN